MKTHLFFSTIAILIGLVSLTGCAPKAQIIKTANGEIHKTFYKNGELLGELLYKNGKQEGVTKTYYKSGELESEQLYINDMLEGLTKTYHKNGNVKAELPYVNNKREGLEKVYHENGALMAEFPYVNDKLEGLVKTNSKNGDISNEIFFEKGKAVRGFYIEYGKRGEYTKNQLKRLSDLVEK